MSRTTSVILLVVQFIPLILFPPAVIMRNSKVLTIPIFLILLDIAATAALVAGNRSGWPRAMLVFAQGLNVTSRLMMLVAQSMTSKSTPPDVAFILTDSVSVVISIVALYMFDQYQLNIRSA